MPAKKRIIKDIKKVSDIFLDKEKEEKILNEMIERRKKGNSILITGLIPIELFKEFHYDAVEHKRSESSLIESIIAEHYAPYNLKTKGGK